MHNVLVLEDHPETRQWLIDILNNAFHEVTIAEASSQAQAFQHLKHNKFDLALIDLNLPDGNGVDTIRKITKESPNTYCVVATIFDDDEYLFPALEAGAQGYLLKEQTSEEFIHSLQGIIKGEPPISPSIARKMINHFHADTSDDTSDKPELSKREKEILSAIAKGLSRNEAAEVLGITSNTVASHLKSIYGKLNVSNRAQATLEALRLGLVKP
ncbi:MAG: response regulator transcription factor [Gammaproteobacteria bacterium]|nr:response regulator transcription factor [Gammaproteobacteria bacterium]